eukprot:gene34161-41351_t
MRVMSFKSFTNFVRPRNQCFSMSTFDRVFRRDLNQEKFLSLANEIKQIVLTPELAGVGVIRSIQVGKGLTRVVRDYTLNRSSFSTPDGQLSLPKVIRRLFEELGATYIKVGQFIASSPTIFPADYVEEFQRCLDNTPTVSYNIIRKIIQEDLKQPIANIYTYVDPTPLASASIAQVHRAQLKDGTKVVIKVRKPGVDATLKADLAFLSIASKFVEFINPSLSALSVANIVEDIRDSMLDELDFRKELKNLENFRSFLEKQKITDAIAPKPYLQASSERVLTMDYLQGVPLTTIQSSPAESSSQMPDIVYPNEQTLLTALRTWAITVAANDQFHADVHAGNLLVLPDGKVGFIDFGIVGKISDTFRDAIGSLFDSFVNGDYEGVARSLVAMGATNRDVDIQKFAKDLAEIVKKITSLQGEVNIRTSPTGDLVDAQVLVDERETTKIVLEVVGVAEKNGLKLPREFGLVLKQALYFDRYQKILAPDIDPLRDERLRGRFADELFPGR